MDPSDAPSVPDGAPDSSLTDRTISALRATHDELAGVVQGLSVEQLTAGSGATDWTVAQVLSHLGSGAEISLATLQSAVSGVPAPDQSFNQTVWDRWNALTPQEQATGYLAADGALVAEVEALTAEQRADLPVTLGFLPEPLAVSGYVGMRLNEAALHSWDVQVAFDPSATVDESTAELLAELFAGELGFLLGFTTKPDVLAGPAVVGVPGSELALVIGESVTLSSGAAQLTAAFDGPVESMIRLLAGRLTPAHTPSAVAVSGAVTLDDLRRVFPGY